MSNFIKTQIDDTVPELHWEAELDNGTVAYEFEDPLIGKNCWFALIDYCKANVIGVNNLYIVARSHRVEFDRDRLSDILIGGWFFTKKAIAVLSDSETCLAYVLGVLQGDKVYTQTFKTPELIIIDQDVREKDNCRHNLLETPTRATLRGNISKVLGTAANNLVNSLIVEKAEKNGE